MKTIGLIGGMSWESTVTYYQAINRAVQKALGGLHSAKLLMYSVDFDEIERCQSAGEWEKSGEILADAARRLEQAGADFLVICTNTMHKVVPQISRQVRLPILHIADATAQVLTDAGISRAGLLGTKYTLTQEFYKDRLSGRGISVLIPDDPDIELVNQIIYQELCLGVISERSRKEYVRIIRTLQEKGAQAVILGCTEIGLLIGPKDSPLPIFDTTMIHAAAAADAALETT